MSTFVEIASDEYDAAAFNDFDASAGGFKIGNARALMWMAQLAYETHNPSTIQVVSGKWHFSSAIPVPDPPQLHFEAEEAKAAVGYLIQPIERRTVFLCEPRGDPDNRNSVQA